MYGALEFYYNNEEVIHEAIRQTRELGAQLSARSAQAALEEMRAHKNAVTAQLRPQHRSIDLIIDTICHSPASSRAKTSRVFLLVAGGRGR